MRSRSSSEPREEELAALADDSLAPERRAEIEALAASTPELTARLEEQRRAVALLQGAAEEVEAPAGLRHRVEGKRSPFHWIEGRRSPFHWIEGRRSRFAWGGLAIGAAAVAALAVVLLLPESVGGPSVAQASVLGARPATAGAPGAASPTLLARDVEGVSFPRWAKEFGWKATGVREDTIGGRRATTVFYEKGGKRIGYTIVAGSKLKWPQGAKIESRGPTDFRLVTIGGRHVVTWLRHGRTCILSGDIPFAKLVKLADWRGKGSVTF
jgi:anti-sigma factor RsiW